MSENDIARLELLLREHFAKTDKQLADMRADNAEFRSGMMREFQAFTEKIDSRFSAFETKVDAKIEALDKKFEAKIDALDKKVDALDKKFEAKIDALDKKVETKIEALDKKVETRIDTLDKKFESKIDNIQIQLQVMQNDITGLKHDVGNLFTWNYWMLSIILALMVMLHIGEAIKTIFTAIAEGLSALISVFRSKNKN